jgi:DUF4097 and DUF4098 domain-containing protein YvlB
MRRTCLVTAICLAVAAPASAQDLISSRKVARSRYQGRNAGREQTERFSGKYRIGRDGRVSISNISGDIAVTAASGDEVSVEAVKRVRGDQSQLASVRIEVDSGPGRVDIRTLHDGRNDRASVDYTVTVPAGVTLDAHSVSGSIKVTGIRGSIRTETISGNVTATDTPRLASARSVSGNITVSGVTDGDSLTAGSVSGNVSVRSVKVRSLETSSVSGDLGMADITCERLTAKSVSGGVEYTGTIDKGGSYDFNVHSGTIRLALANPAGFVLNGNSFSGTVRSELPLTIGGDSSMSDRNRRGRRDPMNNHSIRATYGDGSATVTARTFSGDIILSRR